MNRKELIESYEKKKKNISLALDKFKNLNEKDYYLEFLFCTLTPQSKAHSCWEAVQEILKGKLEENRLKSILSKKTRFHNNKAKYILKNKEIWPKVKEKLSQTDINQTKQLRDYIAENVYGYGLKEASHFLR